MEQPGGDEAQAREARHVISQLLSPHETRRSKENVLSASFGDMGRVMRENPVPPGLMEGVQLPVPLAADMIHVAGAGAGAGADSRDNQAAAAALRRALKASGDSTGAGGEGRRRGRKRKGKGSM